MVMMVRRQWQQRWPRGVDDGDGDGDGGATVFRQQLVLLWYLYSSVLLLYLLYSNTDTMVQS